MKRVNDSPLENALPEGLKEEVLDNAVRASGYPLQNVIASYLEESFDIVEEWGFVDRDTKKHRSLDLHAYKSLKKDGAKHFDAALVLLLECKRAELPYVFFKAVSARTPVDFPDVVGFRSPYFELQGKEAVQDHPPASFLCLHELPFVNDGPPICNAFTRSHRKGDGLELSGEVAFNSVVLPLAGAMQHWKQMRQPGGTQDRYYPELSLSVCVLDAPMVLAAGTPECSDLTLSPWVRVVHQESYHGGVRIGYRHHVVEVVHRAYFQEFLTQHVMPFAEAFALRILEKEDIVAAGRGKVPDWNHWTWSELSNAPARK